MYPAREDDIVHGAPQRPGDVDAGVADVVHLHHPRVLLHVRHVDQEVAAVQRKLRVIGNADGRMLPRDPDISRRLSYGRQTGVGNRLGTAAENLKSETRQSQSSHLRQLLQSEQLVIGMKC